MGNEVLHNTILIEINPSFTIEDLEFRMPKYLTNRYFPFQWHLNVWNIKPNAHFNVLSVFQNKTPAFKFFAGLPSIRESASDQIESNG